MPVNIIVALIALLAALLLYSFATFGALRKKTLTRTHVVLLWVGFVFDVVATAGMAIQIGGLDLRPGTPLLHTVLALLGMAGMLAAAALGGWALTRKDEKALAGVSRWILAPWALWVGVFVWGMIDRGAARIGG